MGATDGFDVALREAVGADWVHAAPPCRTFTRSRRKDAFGSDRQLRSDAHPEGWGDQEAEDASWVAKRLAAICFKRHRADRYWSIENPADSFLWEMKDYKKLAALVGVTMLLLDQCAYGALSKKPTAILSNAPWLFGSGRLCKDAPAHEHLTLQGHTWDYRVSPPVRVWRTALAAEYTQAL